MRGCPVPRFRGRGFPSALFGQRKDPCEFIKRTQGMRIHRLSSYSIDVSSTLELVIWVAGKDQFRLPPVNMASYGRASNADWACQIFPFLNWCHSATKTVASAGAFV
jgi:hypothetical protein